ncbi:class I SAM-dependent methyltransferase [Methylophilus aquaticus]|uniref:SAM-dependent methyltransferase n=1 Tax=Methylophilus aquaticus TaxID=1971610 RepID=A0ABT9JWF0_9PROT|nr:SAM-dependent methyltransferase [Methylophilus aquaticus]MDP8568809.1 SAM-dependent methyltransferase [Methylophilus aquaticus]
MTDQRISSPLPLPNAAAQAHSHGLLEKIQQAIHAQGGWISFSAYMQMALYFPHLGYYSGGANKFGLGGDFVTAPEISPLFAQALAHQVLPVLAETQGDVLELGAGTGKLALGLLTRLYEIGHLPAHYRILEVSANLRARQQETLQSKLPAEVFARIEWLDTLPESFQGVVIGNEVLDAIPLHVLQWQNGTWLERGIADEDGLVWQSRPLSDPAIAAHIEVSALPEGYITEVNPAAQGLIASLAVMLQRGLILLPDYGFSFREYYHPQRTQGTLMCHYQHYAHDNPLLYPGLQDITAHVDFTAMAEVAVAHGLDCAGYASQAQFLINCGILQLLQQINPEDSARYLPQVAAVQKLLSPAEMGELFKVLALSKGVQLPLLGFVQGDKRHQL